MLKLPFYDMDKEIVRREGKTIPEIFEEHGEAYFRNLEARFLKEFKSDCCIISTGGGTAINEQNRKIMRETGLVLFLDAPFRDIWRRIHRDPNRPIVKRSTKEEIEALYHQHHPAYKRAAHISVRTEHRSLRQITEFVAFQVHRLKGE